MNIVVVSAGQGDPAAPGRGPLIVEDGSNTGHRLAIIGGRLPPRSGGPPQHVHRAHSETFFVVSGTVRFLSGHDVIDVSAGGTVTAPIGTPHSFANPDADEWAEFTCTMAPGHYVNYFRELARRESMTGREQAQLMAEYSTDLWPTS